MIGPRVGFYVHYHGMGHKHRTEAILQHLTIPASVITSRIDTLEWSGLTLTELIGLDCDNDNLSRDGLRHASDVPSLHFAPLWSQNISNRVAKYTTWLAKSKPDLMVVDVSVEISMLTRLASVPQIVMRQHGDRSDPAHLSAYAAAHSLLAPFPEMMEDEITADWVREKTVYLDGFCRDHATGPSNSAADTSDVATIVFMFGRGGSGDVHERIRAAAKLLPEFQIVVIGKEADEMKAYDPPNLRYLGWIDNATKYTTTANVVVTAAGHNSVMELGNARCKFIAVAQPRPFAEQLRKVEILQREGLAIGLDQWPADEAWPSLIQRAIKLDPSRWDSVFARDGAKQAADHIHEVAAWSHQKREQSAKVSI
ncbi:glycosyltransferase [Rhodopirellula sp. SWK7]|uniref:glycosyltransferase n=1 Tax=Rhodopirellula sp. SWK7 TaxID=595460 RepID=UPI0002BD3CD1|nr:glycosyltransferase [Rhodopirellula sp. SWK7]EMI42935.1 glycosyl transferase family 28 protein [Rhodopirellula sp. SWK7]